MRKRISVIFLISLFVLFIFAGGALAAKKSRIPLRGLPVDGAQPPPAYTAPSPVMYELGMQPDCEDIHPTAPLLVIQHDQFGLTWYDYQKNGSVGRMVAVGPGGHAHGTYHRTDGPYGTAFPRFVDYNCKDPVFGWIGAQPIDGGTNINAGYNNIEVLHDGKTIIIYHTTAEPGDRACVLKVQDAVCVADFSYRYDLPDRTRGEIGEDPAMWPKCGVVYDALVDTDYIHIVATEGKTTGGDQRLAYMRCRFLENDHLLCDMPTGQTGVVSPVDLEPNPVPVQQAQVAYFGECEAPGVPAGQFTNTISAIVATSPVSKKVAIVFTNKREGGDIQVNNDVFYFDSDTNGVDWFPQWAGTWPPTVANGMLVNVTNYKTDDPERAYTDVAACYDYNDHLHIVWNSNYYDSATGDLNFNANLMHWCDTDPPGIDNASIVATGYWDDGILNCGGWNRILSKPSISAKDPIYHPGGDPDSVFLFCTWTQFNLGDNSLGGFTNGEIYGAVSDTFGGKWSPAYNLTGTQTPDCAAGACLSEHWSSMAENMYDGDMYIQYVCDRDAGGAIQDEAAWTENPMMFMHLNQLPSVPACGAGIKLLDPPDWCYPPLKVVPGENRVIIMELTGLYNISGTYQVTTDNPNVVCIFNCSGTLEPQERKEVEILINCVEEGFLTAHVDVHYCIGTEQETTETILLHVVQSEDYYECPRDPATYIEKHNGVLKAKFWANCEERVWDKRLLDTEQDTIQPIFSAAPIVCTSWQGDTIVGRQDYSDILTGARDTMHNFMGPDPDQPGCRIQVVWSKNTFICAWPLPLDTPSNHHRWWWIDIHKQIFMWHDCSPTDTCPTWKKDQIIKQIRITKSQPPAWWPAVGIGSQAYEDIYYGYFADVDAPFDTGCNGCNRAGIEGNTIVWFQGYNAATQTDYEQYYVGLAFSDREGNNLPGLGMHVVRNDSFLYPNNNWGWQDAQLCSIMRTPGWDVQDQPIDTLDRSVVMTAGMIPGGTADFDTQFILVEAFIPTGISGPGAGVPVLVEHIEQTKTQLVPLLDSLGLFDECPDLAICGDANGNGVINSADIVHLINYLFVPGSPPPKWPGDVNFDCVVNSADIVYLINYLFVPGSPPPKCIP